LLASCKAFQYTHPFLLKLVALNIHQISGGATMFGDENWVTIFLNFCN
jgi:hypothetical protein